MLSSLDTLWVILSLVGAAAVLTLCGVHVARSGATLAARTGMGQALFGAVIIGGATSLSGIAASVNAAWSGHAGLALGNALGGIAAQTTFLALADLVYRRANLEHAAASAAALTQACLLIALICLPLLARGTPEWAVFSVHPTSLLLVVGYLAGLRLTARVREEPMWWPRRTAATISDQDEEESEEHRSRTALSLWMELLGSLLLLAACGWLVSEASLVLAHRGGVSETVVGTYLTAVTTSLPELVTALAAVRRGALALAVGDILGGNAFDTLLVAFSDVAYREGSIYEALGPDHVVTIGLAILLTALVALGLVRRQEHGPVNIGFESVLMIAAYTAGVLLLAR